MPSPSATHALAALLAASALSAGCASYRPAPLELPAHEAHWQDREQKTGLSLTPDQAAALALCANPHLRTLRAQAGVAQAAAGFAGLWEDPKFSLGLSRQTAGGTDPWLVEGGIGFSIPLSGRLEVQKKLARQEIDQQQALVLMAEGDLLREVRLALAAKQAAGRKWAVLSSHAERMNALARRAEKIADAGEASRIEAGALTLSAAESSAEAAQAQVEITQAKLRLLELIGLRPEAPLVIRDAPAAWRIPADAQARLNGHPRLTAAKAQYAAAEAAYELEVCRQYPDLDIGPTAKWENGQSSLGLGLGLPIPAWNRNRQAIACAKAGRDAVRAQVEEVQESLRHALAQASAKNASAALRAAQLTRSVAPLLAAQDAQVKALLAAGELDPLRLGEVLDRRRDAALRLVEADQAAAEAQVEVRALVEPYSLAVHCEAVPVPGQGCNPWDQKSAAHHPEGVEQK